MCADRIDLNVKPSRVAIGGVNINGKARPTITGERGNGSASSFQF